MDAAPSTTSTPVSETMMSISDSAPGASDEPVSVHVDKAEILRSEVSPRLQLATRQARPAPRITSMQVVLLETP